MTFWYVELEVLFLENLPDGELWDDHCELEGRERFWS